MQDTLLRNCIFNILLFGGWIFSSAIAILILWLNYSELSTQVCMKPACFGNLLDIYRLPIALATGSTALAAFYALIFRSNQTAVQIQEMKQSNVFSQYSDHRKMFREKLIDFENEYELTLLLKNKMYTVLFPDNSPTCVKFSSSDHLSKWIQDYNNIVTDLGNIAGPQSPKVSRTQYSEWLVNLMILSRDMHITFNEEREVSANKKSFFERAGDEYFWQTIPSDHTYVLESLYGIFATLGVFCNNESKPILQPIFYPETQSILDTYMSEFVDGITIDSPSLSD